MCAFVLDADGLDGLFSSRNTIITKQQCSISCLELDCLLNIFFSSMMNYAKLKIALKILSLAAAAVHILLTKK